MRGAGVGEGIGEGNGVGVGVCAGVVGTLDATKLAAPSAGNNFTNDRRLFEVLRFGWFVFFTVS